MMIDVAATRLRRMRTHARRLAVIVARTVPGQRTPWLSAVVGRSRTMREFVHYPRDDVIDHGSGAQFFAHAHDRKRNGYAHFHSFVRLSGRQFKVGRHNVTTHIAAVAVNKQGWPVKIIVLNQWVIDDLWQPARRTLALLERMRFDARSPAGDAGRWLESLLHVYWPELKRLLEVRDQRLRRALEKHPDRNVLQDRRMEILGSVNINLPRRLRALGVS